jgi:hypothetical protein
VDADGVRALTFGGDQQTTTAAVTTRVQTLTSRKLDVRGSGEHQENPAGATLEIKVKRSGRTSISNNNNNNNMSARIEFQFTTDDMKGRWKTLEILDDSEKISTSTYSYSNDGGRTQTMRSYYDDSSDEYQTYLLQANGDDMHSDLLSDDMLWQTAKFRLLQPLSSSHVQWSVDAVSLYVGNKRKGLSTSQLGTGKISRDWCYPVKEMVEPYKYVFGTSQSSNGDNSKQTVLRFEGPMEGVSTIRSRKSFRAPSIVQIQGEIDSKCSNHVVILTTEKYYKYDADPHPDAIRFVYDCGTKKILGGSMKTTVSGKCPKFDRRIPPSPPKRKHTIRTQPSNQSVTILHSSFPLLSER